MSQPRYPGVQPFSEAQGKIFFGRQKATRDLFRLILQERLVVLHAKSGLGKSSLLNAGVIPLMRQKEKYHPITVRFRAYTGQEDLPVHATQELIKRGQPQLNTFVDKLIENDPSIWHDLKEQQILNDSEEGILLIFDQFEEFFTYPPAAQLVFRRQLAEALYTKLPQRYWDILDLYDKDELPLSNEELQILQQEINLRVVIAIREDRVHLLGKLSDYLPTISKNWYSLEALNESEAKEAIINPAQLEGNFESKPFTYTEHALTAILTFLTKEYTQKIEGTQLQIICDSIENKVVDYQLKEVKREDIGDLNELIKTYYEKRIQDIKNPVERLAARVLIEENLIFESEERRLSMYEGQVLVQIKETTLKQLVNSHLIRREQSPRGGFTYELCHDTLVEPVLLAKKKRVAAEEVAAEIKRREERKAELLAAREEANKERRRREAAEKSQRNLRIMAVFLGLFLVGAVVSLWYAYGQKRKTDLANIKVETINEQLAEDKKVLQQTIDEFEREKRERQALQIKELLRQAEVFRKAEKPALELRKLQRVLKINPAHQLAAELKRKAEMKIK